MSADVSEAGAGIELKAVNKLSTAGNSVQPSVNGDVKIDVEHSENPDHSKNGHNNVSGFVNGGFQSNDAKYTVNSSKYTPEDVEKSDETLENDDEDEDGEPGRFERCVTSCRNAVINFWQRHKKHIKWAFLILLAAGYVCYFGYAMHYQFGDEGSIRLLWVTCVVVVCLLLKLSLYCCRRHDVPTPSQWTCWSRCHGHQRLINWIILGVLYLFIVIFVIVDITLVSKTPYNLVALSGIALFIIIPIIFSKNPVKINWLTVLWGTILQFIFALIVLRWQAGYTAFQWLGDRVSEFYAYAQAGESFVFGPNYTSVYFAFAVLPVTIFFSSVLSVLSYWGITQWIIRKIAWIFQTTMGTTAPESLVAAANIFLSQTEAPLMIRHLMAHLTISELHAVMTAGFATIAAGVLGAYIAMGVPANHLLTASVMSAPASLVLAKLFYPEIRKPHLSKVLINKKEKRTEINVIDAAAHGASNAIPMVANIAANLIAVLSILQFINTTLTWFGNRVGIPQLTFQMICSYVLWPLALVMGTDVTDCRNVAQMIGTKTFLNEYVAYSQLSIFLDNRKQLNAHVGANGTWYWDGDDVILAPHSASFNKTVLTGGVISDRSVLIATYALCGFSNFGSIGIQLGGLGAMAPSRRSDLAKIAMMAMWAGNIACFMTACIAGLFFQGLT